LSCKEEEDKISLPQHPFARTVPADQITQTSATLNGTVNANGSLTYVKFELIHTFEIYIWPARDFVREDFYIDAVPAIVTGTTEKRVSATLNSLSPNGRYYFRIEAWNDAGTSIGEYQDIYLALPPKAKTLNASSVSGTTATLNGWINSYHTIPSIRGFEYGTTTDYGSFVDATNSLPVYDSQDVYSNVSNLNRGTTYHFRMKVVTSAGSAVGEDLTFTTTP
jgi:hypothetical protein